VRKFRREPELNELARSASEEAAQRELETLRVRIGLLEEVFDALPLGVVVNSPTGVEMFRNAAFVDTSTPRGVLAKLAVDEMIAKTKAGPVSDVVEVHGPPRQSLKVAAHELGSGATVATVEDITELRRVEAVRRDFIANISHELRTPVGAIGLLAETLSGETDPTTQARLTLRLETEAHRMATMVDDLLSLTRVEAEGGATMEVIELTSIVSTVYERAEASAEFANVDLQIGVVPGHWRVLGDRRQLVSALTNLVDNALKYSGAGTVVAVDVALEPADPKGGTALDVRLSTSMVVFRVKDQGIGIPARDRERIFERFYRVDKARARDTGGTGLGLAIVRHVAVNHRGDVHVESVEGMGSTFVLRIPAAPLATERATEGDSITAHR
jgi:two-component system, OmpR family, sensor histidine kinase SenX3